MIYEHNLFYYTTVSIHIYVKLGNNKIISFKNYSYDMPVKSGRTVIPVHIETRKNGPFPFISTGRFSVVASTCLLFIKNLYSII